MKTSRHAPSVTSLPLAPQDEARSRMRNYSITMGIRMLCFVLMVVVQPLGWYTWVFALGAITLPYIAVVFANASRRQASQAPESPELMIGSGGSAAPPEGSPAVIRLGETDDGQSRGDIPEPSPGEER